MKRLLIAPMAVILAAACTENKKVEKVYPVGDRAFYQVAGNVESIVFHDVTGEFIFLGDKPKFNKSGLFFVNEIKYKETKEGENTILELDTDDEDGGGEEYIRCAYDKDGRLTNVTFWESAFTDISYDEQGRLAGFTALGMMDIESEYVYTFTYGKDRNPIKVAVKETHPDYENPGKYNTQNYTFTYEYTAVDENGNWTERKNQDGTVEKRTINYFPAE